MSLAETSPTTRRVAFVGADGKRCVGTAQPHGSGVRVTLETIDGAPVSHAVAEHWTADEARGLTEAERPEGRHRNPYQLENDWFGLYTGDTSRDDVLFPKVRTQPERWDVWNDGEEAVTLRPIERWPQPSTRDREASPFRVTLRNTLKLLERELRMLSAKSVVLQIAIREGGFRRDGLPRADARAEHPGVILSFESTHGPLSLPCDTFRNWQDNLRAIAFHLEHLRHASLYGVGHRGEQYRGWKALPEGDGTTEGPFTPETAAAFLVEIARQGQVATHPKAVLTDESTFNAVQRAATRVAHPDAGGDNETFLRVREAIEVVKASVGKAATR